MTGPTYDAAARLARLAAGLKGPRGGLPALFAFTDPDRTPDPVALALQLPSGSGLVLRTFGRPDVEAAAPVIAAIAEQRELIFLVSADPDLAARSGAHGVHWPQARLTQAARCRFRGRFRGLQTASAHSPMAVRRASGLVDAVFVSPAFASKSPSASHPLGPHRMTVYARRAKVPIYALGGINHKTIKRLSHTHLSGVAAVGGLSG